ncbi:MAG: hypothetical protein L0228_17190 [Planctomycetes bacterium]|nr:hypothetical protein [Planctomycetota bacterium]
MHHACQHGVTAVLCTAQRHAEHHCDGHHAGDGEQPVDGDHAPADPCQHAVCSYVKAETQRVDLSDGGAASFTLAAPVNTATDVQVASAKSEPICRADLSSTHLYVWHCALII